MLASDKRLAALERKSSAHAWLYPHAFNLFELDLIARPIPQDPTQRKPSSERPSRRLDERQRSKGAPLYLTRLGGASDYPVSTASHASLSPHLPQGRVVWPRQR